MADMYIGNPNTFAATYLSILDIIDCINSWGSEPETDVVKPRNSSAGIVAAYQRVKFVEETLQCNDHVPLTM
jgi:GTP cyclohydrolase FolE2